MIRPLPKRNSLGADMAQQLQEMILQGIYKPGDVLPSQRDLAKQFGTSLPTVREAISILATIGLLEAQPGRGTVICAQDNSNNLNSLFQAVSQTHEAQEFLAARKLLEHYTLTNAAKHATPNQIADMRAILMDMTAAQDNIENYIEADFALHFAIANASGNRVVTQLLHVIHTPLAGLLRNLSTTLFQTQGFQKLHQAHSNMVEAIAQRQATQATNAFDDMLEQILSAEDLSTALENNSTDPELGNDFLEDLRWNFTRLVGPMATIVIKDAANELGIRLEHLKSSQLERFLQSIARQLPDNQREEYSVIETLLQKRYANKTN
jgi:GntR family transcriptional regulator, transcriptional repressor for pyruvate dehydrogenase complex